MSYNYIYNSENNMYTATIYDASNPDYHEIVRKKDSIRIFLELKVIWYCFRKFPLRHTLYTHHGQDLVFVSIYGVRVAKIVFDEQLPEVELNRCVPAI